MRNPAAEVGKEKKRILEDTDHAVRVFKAIYMRQKPEERFTGRHMGHDSRGFRAHETVSLNALYEELAGYGWRLTPMQADKVRTTMEPYADQYLTAIDEDPDAGLEAEPSPAEQRRQKIRRNAEKRGVTFSESYDAARGGTGTVAKQRRKLTEEEKDAIAAALLRMEGG